MKWYRSLLKRLLTVLFFALSGAIMAALPQALYQGQVPIASHSASDWDKAVGPALAQVLVKVSGNVQINDMQVIKQELTKASGYVQSFNYITDADIRALSVQIRFSPKAVDNLLQSVSQTLVAAEPSMAENLSPTLVWLAVQDEHGQSQLVTDGNDSTVMGLQQQADKNNLALLWPAGDLQDISNVSANQVWQLDQPAVQRASQRYQAHNILLGRIQKQPDGSSQGEWMMMTNQGSMSWQTQGDSASQAVTAVFAKLADLTSAASTGEPVTAGLVTGQVDLNVVGVNSLTDYAALINYLRSLASVAGVNTTRMGGDRITLSVSLSAQQNAFVNEISQSNKLTAVNTENPVILTYRWTGIKAAISSPTQATPIITDNGQAAANAQSYPVTDSPMQFSPNASNPVPEEVSP